MALIDPELVRQLADADADGTVEAVVRLKAVKDAVTPAPDQTERITHDLVSRAQRSSGRREYGVNVFRYMGSFAVSGPKVFVEHLIHQPEVAAAVANRQPDTGMIPPASKRPVKLKDVGREQKRRPARKTSKRRRAPR